MNAFDLPSRSAWVFGKVTISRSSVGTFFGGLRKLTIIKWMPHLFLRLARQGGRGLLFGERTVLTGGMTVVRVGGDRRP